MKKGGKVSNETRLKMIKAWEDPARRQKYLDRLRKAGRLHPWVTPGKHGTSASFLDEDFEEVGY